MLPDLVILDPNVTLSLPKSLNAILMPYVLVANRPAIEEKILRLTHYLSISNGFDGFLDWILQMRLELEIEHSLSELGVDSLHLDRLATMATVAN